MRGTGIFRVFRSCQFDKIYFASVLVLLSKNTCSLTLHLFGQGGATALFILEKKQESDQNLSIIKGSSTSICNF